MNAGARADPINMSPRIPDFFCPFARKELLFLCAVFTKGTLDQRVGNIKVRPTKATKTPERCIQNSFGTFNISEETFMRTVNNTMAITKDPMIVYEFLLVSEMEPPITTGRRGKIHGTNAVRIPAMKETNKRYPILL